MLAAKGSLYVTRPTLFTHIATREATQAMADDLFAVVGSGAGEDPHRPALCAGRRGAGAPRPGSAQDHRLQRAAALIGGRAPRMPRRVFVLGATGTIGRATVRALVRRGHEVVCFVRPRAGVGGALAADDSARLLAGAELRLGDVRDPASLARDGFRGERFDALVSCLASRTGAPKDAWAIDHQAHLHALAAAREAGVSHVVLLSAICVQKPLLAFQQAKLAFEKALVESGITYSIVRPTAFFKSLSGQIERVRQGKPFLVFGDGTLTACKPISDDDLGDYLADCLDEDDRRNRVLPIGGPGEAITPRQQGEQLFALLGRAPRFKQVPVGLLDAIIAVLGAAGRTAACARRQGRAGAHRSLLRHRVDAGARPGDRPLRRRRHAVDRHRDAVRLLCRAAERQASRPSAATMRCSERRAASVGHRRAVGMPRGMAEHRADHQQPGKPGQHAPAPPAR